MSRQGNTQLHRRRVLNARQRIILTPPARPPTRTTSTSTTSTTTTSQTTRTTDTETESETSTTTSETTTSAPLTTNSPNTSLPPTTSNTRPATSNTSLTSATSQTTSTTATSGSVGPSTSTTNHDQAGGLGIGSILGIVAGSVIGLIVACMLVAFVIRHTRKRRLRRDFDLPSPKNDDTQEKLLPARPRPPSLIERRAAAAINSVAMTAPSSAYPYSDAASVYSERTNGTFHGYGAGGPNPFAVPVPPPGHPHAMQGGVVQPQFGGFGQEHPGYGAPPIPGTYGPSGYATYGNTPDPRYGNYGPRAQQPFGNAPGPHVPNGQVPDPAMSVRSYPDPRPESSYGGAPSVAPSSATRSPVDRPHPLRVATMDDTAATNTRQSQEEAPPAYEPNGTHEKLRTNEKSRYVPAGSASTSSPSASSVGPSSSPASPPISAAPAPTPASAPSATQPQPSSTTTRPTSTYTVYDADDVYGGI